MGFSLEEVFFANIDHFFLESHDMWLSPLFVIDFAQIASFALHLTSCLHPSFIALVAVACVKGSEAWMKAVSIFAFALGDFSITHKAHKSLSSGRWHLLECVRSEVHPFSPSSDSVCFLAHRWLSRITARSLFCFDGILDL